ncbi:MAG: MBL fold metallo-hydrolase [Planctomycetota bacterium]|nr:MAG: MBL fold metallo-hydrolase [Planctomycetota bacterium]
METLENLLVFSKPVGIFQMNCYVVGDRVTREGVVVDAGAESGVILDMVERSGLQIRYLFCTHAHIDHVMAVLDLKRELGVPFGLHREERFWLDALPEQAAMFGLPFSGEVPEVDIELREGDTFSFGRFEMRVFEVPGHSPGHVMFLVEDKLFSGDCVFYRSIGRTDLPRCSYDLLMESITKKILTLPEETTIFPGHGPATTVGDEKKYNPFFGTEV